jgi:hypothetical protein
MKGPIVLILSFLAASMAFGQSSVLSKVSFSVASQPEQDGSNLAANLGYRFSDRFSSGIYVKRLMTAETDELAIETATKSQNLSRSDVTEIFILPAEFNLGILGQRGIDVGAGIYVSAGAVRDVGFFKIPTGTNSYDSANSFTFYGPLLTLETDIKAGFLDLTPRISLVPFFMFSSEQSLEIDPLLAAEGKGSIKYSSNGIPYVAVSAEAKLFNLFGVDLAYEMSRQNARIINAPDSAYGGSHSGWWGKEALLTSSTFRVIGNVLLTLSNGSFIKLGYGQRITTTLQEGESAISISKSIFNIAYELKK